MLLLGKDKSLEPTEFYAATRWLLLSSTRPHTPLAHTVVHSE